MQKFNMQGSAILTALFIMILVAISATAMSLRLQIDINRTQLITNISSLKSFAIEGENLMINQLIQNGLTYSITSHQNIDINNLKVITRNSKNDTREVVLLDLQSQFNLNNLKYKNQLESLTTLINTLHPKTSKENAFFIALFTQEWITKKKQNIRNMTTETYYQSLKEPYLPTHKLFTSLSEWRWVKDVSQTLFNTISPYLAALPEETPLNLNSASKNILKTLHKDLSEQKINDIVKARGKKGFRTLQEALNLPVIKALKLNKKQLTLTSDYFLISSRVSNKETELTLYTMIKRTIDKKGIKISVLDQTINTY